MKIREIPFETTKLPAEDLCYIEVFLFDETESMISCTYIALCMLCDLRQAVNVTDGHTDIRLHWGRCRTCAYAPGTSEHPQ